MIIKLQTYDEEDEEDDDDVDTEGDSEEAEEPEVEDMQEFDLDSHDDANEVKFVPRLQGEGGWWMDGWGMDKKQNFNIPPMFFMVHAIPRSTYWLEVNKEQQ